MCASSLYRRVAAALLENRPETKAEASLALWRDWQRGALEVNPDDDRPVALPRPGQPERPVLVQPKQLPRRSLHSAEGRAAMLHAICHIEFNAINLALDAVWRFREVPQAFITDWLEVAADEARHFALLSNLLRDRGFSYGDFPAHNGLWEMAVKTAHSLQARMGMVPRVLEARGLDVTPGIQARFRQVGDEAACAVLDVILREEVDHVRKGNRWFAWACERAGEAVEAAFARLLQQYYPRGLQGPFNCEARLHAGFGEGELRRLGCRL